MCENIDELEYLSHDFLAWDVEQYEENPCAGISEGMFGSGRGAGE